jgi:hypothetical protein
MVRTGGQPIGPLKTTASPPARLAVTTLFAMNWRHG